MKRAHSAWPMALKVHEAWMVSWRRSRCWLMSKAVGPPPSPTRATRPQVPALRTAATRASAHARAVHGGLGAVAVGQLVDGLDRIGVLRVDHRVGPELLGEGEALRRDVHRDDARAHGMAEHGGGEPDRSLAEDGEGVAPRGVDALQRSVGGAGAAGDRRAFLEGELVGQGNHGEGGGLHERRVPAVSRHAVDGDAVPAELRPADAAVLAAPAALVVMVHDSGAHRREIRRHARADRRHHAARLMSGDDRPAAAQAEGRRGIADRAVGVQVAAAHAGGLDGDDDLARPRRGIGEFLDLQLPLSEEDDAAHSGWTLLWPFGECRPP